MDLKLIPARFTDFLMSVAVFVLFVNSFFLYQSYFSLDALKKANRNIRVEDQLLSDVQTAECGQRGYLYTGNEKYLPQYYIGKERARKDLALLKVYMGLNIPSQVIMAQLENDINSKLAELDATIVAYKQGNRTQALDIVSAGRGMLLMDNIETNINILRRQNE